MRLRALSVTGVGGLPDGRVTLPNDPLVAFARTNGTGKSKLLACLLSPWSQIVPGAGGVELSEASVELTLSMVERAALAELSLTAGWGEAAIPRT
jgi:hypothetical protein